jgi:hypothetical protein
LGVAGDGVAEQALVEQNHAGGLGAGEMERLLGAAIDVVEDAGIGGADAGEILGAEVLLEAAPFFRGEEGALEGVVDEDVGVVFFCARRGAQDDGGLDDGMEKALGGDEPIALVCGLVDADVPGLAAGVFALRADAVEVANVIRGDGLG